MPFFVLPFPAINPVLVHWGPLAIRWYALAYISGLILGWHLIRRIVADERYWSGAIRPTRDSIDDMLVYCALGVVIGGRLGYVLFYDFGHYLADPLAILRVWEGGMAFHGGLTGAALGIWLFSRRYRVPALTSFDLASLVAPIGLFFGRLANFIKPELWGRPTDVSWAMIFKDANGNLVPPDGLPRHPSQLYEAGLEGLLTFVALMIAARAGGLKYPGRIAGAFGVLYALARTFSEFFRDHPVSEELGGGLTKGMLLSAPVFLIGLALLFHSLGKTRAAA